MKDMLSADGNACPFAFNMDPATFKVGDMVSFRMPDTCGDFPLVGTLVEVHEDHVIISEASDPSERLKGTRVSRPIVRSAGGRPTE